MNFMSNTVPNELEIQGIRDQVKYHKEKLASEQISLPKACVDGLLSKKAVYDALSHRKNLIKKFEKELKDGLIKARKPRSSAAA